MKTYTKTVQETKPRLIIRNDSDMESPREWDNLGYFITCDSKHNSPDNNQALQSLVENNGQSATSQAEHIKMIKAGMKAENLGKVLAVYPVTKHEHGSVSYSLGTVHGFDSSNNSFYIVTKESADLIGAEAKDFEKIIKAEIETYNKWINGEVYVFTLYDDKGEVEESCGGFYAIEDIREYLPKEWADEDLSDYIKN